MQVKSCSCSINNNIKKISEKRATITITTANSSKREKNKFLARNSYGRWIFWICHQYCCCCCCCCLLFYRCHTFLFHLLLNLCFIYWKRTPLFPCTHTHPHIPWPMPFQFVRRCLFPGSLVVYTRWSNHIILILFFFFPSPFYSELCFFLLLTICSSSHPSRLSQAVHAIDYMKYDCALRFYIHSFTSIPIFYARSFFFSLYISIFLACVQTLLDLLHCMLYHTWAFSLSLAHFNPFGSWSTKWWRSVKKQTYNFFKKVVTFMDN